MPAASPRATDLTLTIAQASRIAEMFSVSTKIMASMSFSNCPTDARRFIAKEPIQHCSKCTPNAHGSSPILRGELQGLRINCPRCGLQFQAVGGDNRKAIFVPYRTAALRGERLLNDHAEQSKETWLPPLEIARLLLMRRLPRPILSGHNLWCYRILGTIIPNLDAFLVRQTSFPFSPKNPILPLNVRPALLAGVAIVERSGPTLLKMLQGHIIGENKNRFIIATDHLIYPAFEWDHRNLTIKR